LQLESKVVIEANENDQSYIKEAFSNASVQPGAGKRHAPPALVTHPQSQNQLNLDCFILCCTASNHLLIQHDPAGRLSSRLF
jgi:hypothetical protein